VSEKVLVPLEGKKYLDWRECLDAERYDAVFVCTYNNTIADVVCKALEKGSHVFSEKPPGRNLDDTNQMYEASCRYPDRILKFGFNHRFHHSVIEAKSLVDSGILGKVVCARGVYGKAGDPKLLTPWRSDRNIAGGGILLDQGIHMLDLLYYFLGDFTLIHGMTDNFGGLTGGLDDNAFAILRTADGKTASLHSSAMQWRHKFNLEIVCTHGYITLSGLITSTNSYGEETLSFFKRDIGLTSGPMGKPVEQTYFFTKDDSWELELEEFHDAVLGHRTHYNGNIKDALSIMSYVTKIYEDSDAPQENILSPFSGQPQKRVA
jgi:predicted dehydrogenase